MEFTYNNNYHSSIGMQLFKALYRRRCRTPLSWNQDRERVTIGPELLQQTIKNLCPKFLELYKIIKRIGPVSYEIELPPSLTNIHNVFHVSQLRKYVSSPEH
ncbi:hypothetical protein V8G54_021384 [Vigna mungo]|uniref:Tf2-1-like SH3-like domain-containing protein n=1 Tax=Vigna mungo TaxID=3915 RepID=A0AAQ3NG06_VIGMU